MIILCVIYLTYNFNFLVRGDYHVLVPTVVSNDLFVVGVLFYETKPGNKKITIMNINEQLKKIAR